MIKGIYLSDIAIDCKNAGAMQSFYAQLLGWEACMLYDSPAVRNEAGLALIFMEADFEYVLPVWPEETGRQQKQMHFDFQVDDLAAAVKEAETLGARKADSQFGGEVLVTMIDPEGHPFDLCLE